MTPARLRRGEIEAGEIEEAEIQPGEISRRAVPRLDQPFHDLAHREIGGGGNLGRQRDGAGEQKSETAAGELHAAPPRP